jgi:enoyl-CoA hydratase/3-hydroxyacyl-CoA dehydrogenase
VRGFVITGYGPKAFCAGADIERFPAVLAKKDAAVQYARDCSRLLVRLDRAKKPVVAALNGMALGGGFELAMRCHALLAVKDAFFQLPEVTLGIAPGIGGMVVPYRRWPSAAAVFHDMLRLGKKLTAVEAHRLGVVEALADDTAGLIRAAVARVKQLGASVPRIAERAPALGQLPRVDPTTGKLPLSREVVGLIEQAILGASKAPTLGEALEVGYLAFGESACTRAAAEGIAAFLEGRKPDFAATG